MHRDDCDCLTCEDLAAGFPDGHPLHGLRWADDDQVPLPGMQVPAEWLKPWCVPGGDAVPLSEGDVLEHERAVQS